MEFVVAALPALDLPAAGSPTFQFTGTYPRVGVGHEFPVETHRAGATALAVGRMTCPGCAQTIERLLSRVPGGRARHRRFRSRHRHYHWICCSDRADPSRGSRWLRRLTLGRRQEKSVGGSNAAELGHIVLPIEGMSCATCVACVERALAVLPGVQATVNLSSEHADIIFDSARVAPPALARPWCALAMMCHARRASLRSPG